MKYVIFLILFILSINSSILAQDFLDVHVPVDYEFDCSLKSSSTTSQKTIRVNFHFISDDSGNGSYTATTGPDGIASDYNGYWYAKEYIRRMNSYLSNNLPMNHQLDSCPIPVDPINIQLDLNCVYFQCNSSWYNDYNMCISQIDNDNDQVINVVIGNWIYSPHPTAGGVAIPSRRITLIFKTNLKFEEYISKGSTWPIVSQCGLVLHEIGHLFSLDHTMLSPSGGKCYDDLTCHDLCDDTPTYPDLIAEGYSNPYSWNDEESSNNIMEYGANTRSWTPCQILQAHDYIENIIPYTQVGEYSTPSATINSFNQNASYIAQKVSTSSSSVITIGTNEQLYIDAKEFEINGEFEVPLGSTFEFTPFCD